MPGARPRSTEKREDQSLIEANKRERSEHAKKTTTTKKLSLTLFFLLLLLLLFFGVFSLFFFAPPSSGCVSSAASLSAQVRPFRHNELVVQRRGAGELCRGGAWERDGECTCTVVASQTLEFRLQRKTRKFCPERSFRPHTLLPPHITETVQKWRTTVSTETPGRQGGWKREFGEEFRQQGA